MKSTGAYKVIAFPPPRRRRWQWWVPTRPIILDSNVDCYISPTGDEARVFRPRRGWQYQVVYIHDVAQA